MSEHIFEHGKYYEIRNGRKSEVPFRSVSLEDFMNGILFSVDAVERMARSYVGDHYEDYLLNYALEPIISNSYRLVDTVNQKMKACMGEILIDVAGSEKLREFSTVSIATKDIIGVRLVTDAEQEENE